MEVQTTQLDGLYLIKPVVFKDPRGFFFESYSLRTLSEKGISTIFVQDNCSYSSVKGVVRGLHFQLPPYTQTKLVRVVRGAVWDVVVDLRKNSQTFGKWQAFELTAENFQMLYIPKGFAHGFCTLTDNTEFMYKNDAFYEPAYESGIRWNDPTLAIQWPVETPLLSSKDEKLPLFQKLSSPF